MSECTEETCQLCGKHTSFLTTQKVAIHKLPPDMRRRIEELAPPTQQKQAIRTERLLYNGKVAQSTLDASVADMNLKCVALLDEYARDESGDLMFTDWINNQHADLGLPADTLALLPSAQRDTLKTAWRNVREADDDIHALWYEHMYMSEPKLATHPELGTPNVQSRESFRSEAGDILFGRMFPAFTRLLDMYDSAFGYKDGAEPYDPTQVLTAYIMSPTVPTLTYGADSQNFVGFGISDWLGEAYDTWRLKLPRKSDSMFATGPRASMPSRQAVEREAQAAARPSRRVEVQVAGRDETQDTVAATTEFPSFPGSIIGEKLSQVPQFTRETLTSSKEGFAKWFCRAAVTVIAVTAPSVFLHGTSGLPAIWNSTATTTGDMIPIIDSYFPDIAMDMSVDAAYENAVNILGNGFDSYGVVMRAMLVNVLGDRLTEVGNPTQAFLDLIIQPIMVANLSGLVEQLAPDVNRVMTLGTLVAFVSKVMFFAFGGFSQNAFGASPATVGAYGLFFIIPFVKPEWTNMVLKNIGRLRLWWGLKVTQWATSAAKALSIDIGRFIGSSGQVDMESQTFGTTYSPWGQASVLFSEDRKRAYRDELEKQGIKGDDLEQRLARFSAEPMFPPLLFRDEYLSNAELREQADARQAYLDYLDDIGIDDNQYLVLESRGNLPYPDYADDTYEIPPRVLAPVTDVNVKPLMQFGAVASGAFLMLGDVQELKEGILNPLNPFRDESEQVRKWFANIPENFKQAQIELYERTGNRPAVLRRENFDNWFFDHLRDNLYQGDIPPKLKTMWRTGRKGRDLAAKAAEALAVYDEWAAPLRVQRVALSGLERVQSLLPESVKIPIPASGASFSWAWSQTTYVGQRALGSAADSASRLFQSYLNKPVLALPDGE